MKAGDHWLAFPLLALAGGLILGAVLVYAALGSALTARDRSLAEWRDLARDDREASQAARNMELTEAKAWRAATEEVRENYSRVRERLHEREMRLASADGRIVWLGVIILALTLGSRKSVNVPGVRINLPSLTDKDRSNIEWAIKNKLDFIAHSFVRNKRDVLDIQDILDARRSPVKIIAKIENQEGVDNIDEILRVAYGIMIARGDLGIEVPAEKIPGLQRILIRKCVEAKKPVIVATQMLHTMIRNPRPTRAEVTDIANAIYYRTDALMLSGETAYGKYPVEAVQTMSKIIAEAEKTKLSANDIRVPISGDDLDVTSFLAKQAVKSSSKLNVQAIISDSMTGRTARYLAAFRGKATVFAICYRQETMRMLSLSYGVWAVYQPWLKSRRSYYYEALRQLIESGKITEKDKVAYLSGSFGEGGGTTFLEINDVARVLNGGDNYQLPTFGD